MGKHCDQNKIQRPNPTLPADTCVASPEKGVVPPQPKWKAPGKPEPKSNEYWKDLYFKKP